MGSVSRRRSIVRGPAARSLRASPLPAKRLTGRPDYAVFAINLDELAERFATLRRQFPPRHTPALLRVPGVKGRYLPDVATARLADPPAAMQKRARWGASLPMSAAWERFPRERLQPWAVRRG